MWFKIVYMTSEKLSELISSESSLTKTDVIAVLHFLGKKMQLYLEQVKVIDLDYIGKFKMGFQCKGAEDPSQLKSPQSIKKF